jgi:hypothetical protein
MKRLFVLIALFGVLALPQGAAARVTELGSGAGPARSNCPNDPCEAIGRVTGYQGRAGSVRNPFVIRRSGKIVAFTVTLARVTQQQESFFDGLYGGPARVRLAILRKSKRRRSRLNHRLIRQSRSYRVDRFFGSSPSFALDQPLVVRRGYIVALTTPTWHTAFAFSGLGGRNWWRSSRQRGRCRNATQRAAHQRVRTVLRYSCTYFRARLLYTATFVPDPRPTRR